MWVATLALNGLIGAGVPQDWATRSDTNSPRSTASTTRTLAVVLPSLLEVQRQHKRAKLLQYAQRVWNINDGSDDERIDQAIARTRRFFESRGDQDPTVRLRTRAASDRRIVRNSKRTA